MNSPLVSCLTATYGRFSVLQEALDCFLKQDYKNKELIILNNHPEPIRCNLPQVVVINDPGHPTLGDCRNALLELASGELLRTWDDDDLYLPWAISQGVARICDAEAWKPMYSWGWNVGENKITLDENVFEASITFRTDVVKRYGYQPSGGDEHNPLMQNIKFVVEEVGANGASYCYRWGTRYYRISGTLGSGSIEDRTRIWMDANQDTGNGQPLTPVDVTLLFNAIAVARERFFCMT